MIASCGLLVILRYMSELRHLHSLYILIDRTWDACCFFFQAEDGIRYLVRSRGLGDVYKRQLHILRITQFDAQLGLDRLEGIRREAKAGDTGVRHCLLYTSDAADERSSVDLGGRRIIKKKKKEYQVRGGEYE